jgi:hypothetical protein
LLFEKYDGVKVDLSDKVFPYTGKFLLLASDRSGNDIGEFEITAPAADLALEITGCQTVFRGFEPMENATIHVEAKGDNVSYLWSTGETTGSITVSPLESNNYSVTVTNSAGCSGFAQTFVEAIETSCGNGNGEPKVEVCHVKNNGQHQTLCVSISGVWEHLEQGDGHKGCHIGPCDHVSACDDEGKEQVDNDDEKLGMEVENRSEEIEALIFPNPTSNDLNVNLDQIESENVNISIINYSGKVVYANTIRNDIGLFKYSFGENNLPEGLYLVKIDAEGFTKTQTVIHLK